MNALLRNDRLPITIHTEEDLYKLWVDMYCQPKAEMSPFLQLRNVPLRLLS